MEGILISYHIITMKPLLCWPYRHRAQRIIPADNSITISIPLPAWYHVAHSSWSTWGRPSCYSPMRQHISISITARDEVVEGKEGDGGYWRPLGGGGESYPENFSYIPLAPSVIFSLVSRFMVWPVFLPMKSMAVVVSVYIRKSLLTSPPQLYTLHSTI